MKIVLGSNALARYPQGGGHWSCFLQYLIGLRALRHDVFWLEILPRSQPEIDHRRIAIFITRMRRLGLGEKCAVVLHDGDRPQVLSHETTYGVSFVSLKETIQETDALWNFHCSIRTPLLHEFKWKALLDVDPGHLQISALHWDLGIEEHNLLFSVGSKINDRDCKIPKLRKNWHAFFPCAHLPLWRVEPPNREAPITSITQWTWGEDLPFNGYTLAREIAESYLSTERVLGKMIDYCAAA